MPSRIRLERSVGFRAHHRLALPGRTDAENRRQFGWTADPHSHQYRCTVTVEAELRDDEAMAIDLPWLDRWLAAAVVARFDGRHLHRDIPELATIPTTCEAIARVIFRQLADLLPGPARLVSVRIAEDDTLAAECLGDSSG
ncbi:MAG: 6-pyruvoyl trahydropterin synthase family protein [Gemmatimonadales bacterium]